jgi:hypothetical protein
LSALWADAAAKIAALDPALAERLQLKSLLWSDLEEWPDEKVRKLELDLDSLQSKVVELIRKR